MCTNNYNYFIQRTQRLVHMFHSCFFMDISMLLEVDYSKRIFL